MDKMKIEPAQFNPQDAIKLIGCDPIQAAFNQATGTAHSFFSDDGELLGCGGVREFGVGEAWLIVSPKVKGQMKKTLIETTTFTIDQIIRQSRLWKLFAEGHGNFLEHVGFKKREAFIWEAS
jgi:hypothetical protein